MRHVAIQIYKRTGRPTIWIDHEMGIDDTGRQLIDMGYRDRADDILIYVEYPKVGIDRDVLRVRLEATAREYHAAHIVIDSVGKQLAALRLNESDNAEVTRWTMEVGIPVAKRLGIPVSVVDHVAKDGGGASARGASEKMAAADLAWHVHKAEAFTVDTAGVIQLDTRGWDRLGRMPTKRRFGIGGQGEDGPLTLTELDAAEPAPRRSAKKTRQDKARDLLAGDTTVTTAEAAEALSVSPKTAREDLRAAGAEATKRGHWRLAAERPSF